MSNTILDGNGVKAMPRLIPAPNTGSFNSWKETLKLFPHFSKVCYESFISTSFTNVATNGKSEWEPSIF
jgi:hypothetical protein